MTSPKLTPAQLALLRRVHEHVVHVYYPNPARLGNGVYEAPFRRLLRLGLIEIGPYKALKGRPLHTTEAAKALLAADSPEEG